MSLWVPRRLDLQFRIFWQIEKFTGKSGAIPAKSEFAILLDSHRIRQCFSSDLFFIEMSLTFQFIQRR